VDPGSCRRSTRPEIKERVMNELELHEVGGQVQGMSAPEIVYKLDETQEALLFAVKAGRVSFSQGSYRLRMTGQPDVTPGIQFLRTLGLVQLVQLTDRERVPPTRGVKLTTKGEEVAAAYA
jgi:hypothetical protein